jgi:signal transduction histidine kinase/CheY-like chemotaxis protein
MFAFLRRLPLRVILIVPFVLQLFLTVGVTGYLTFTTSRDAVDDMAEQLQHEITERVREYLSSFLASPHRSNQLLLKTIQRENIDVNQINKVAPAVLTSLETFDSISGIGFGNQALGEYVGYGYLLENGTKHIYGDVANAETKNVFVHARLDEKLKPVEELGRTPNYDPRKRGWYQQALRDRKAIWTDIQPIPGKTDDNRLGVLTGLALFNEEQQITGAAVSLLSLRNISQFLEGLKVSRTGRVFVMERSGYLLGSSDGRSPFIAKGSKSEDVIRIAAVNSESHLISAAAQHLKERFGNLNNLNKQQQINFDLGNQRQYLQVSPLQDGKGIDWLIGVVIPQSEFMGSIEQNMQTTLVLSMIALLIAVGVGILTASWISAPILHLNRAAKMLAQGKWDSADISESQRHDEVGQLAQSFTSMAKQLQQSFAELTASQTALQEINANLENEVAKRTHELAAEKEAAEGANRAKSVFLATMSHELRTPLNGILGYAQILARPKDLTPKQQEGVQIIQSSGEYLLTLINDILDVSRIEAGKVELQPSDFHFGAFIEMITNLFEMRAKQKNIAFIYEPVTPLPVAVRIDEKRLRQVLINLLGNAIKFTLSGGVSLRVSYEKGVANFVVEDTGVGIAEEDIERIFLPFQQVGDHKQRAEGTGLGLAITKRLIEMMGGQLSVTSQLGRGSCFTITIDLPAVDTPVQAKVENNQPIIKGYSGKRLKIMVIDDKWENRSVLSNLLSPLGFEIIEACNGAEALEILMQNVPDLILTDLVMPVLDGFEFTRKVRNETEHKDLPIIAVSASVFDLHQQDSIDAGCNAFLAKPIQADTLLQTLQNFLKFTWVYAVPKDFVQSPTVSSDHDVLLAGDALPSSQELHTLYSMAEAGDIAEIRRRIDGLQKVQPQIAVFADRIRSLASSFDEEGLCDFIKNQLSDSE